MKFLSFYKKSQEQIINITSLQKLRLFSLVSIPLGLF
jgi:hypothetical protein